MESIKINYNNAAIKMPKKIMPAIYVFRDRINRKAMLHITNNLYQETYFSNYSFEIYINNVLKHYIDVYSGMEFDINDVNLYETNSTVVTIKGYYVGNTNAFKYEIANYSFIAQIKSVCSENFICCKDNEVDENGNITKYGSALINDVVEGYIDEENDIIYESYDEQEESYSDPIGTINNDNRLFINKFNDKIYKWKSLDSKFELI